MSYSNEPFHPVTMTHARGDVLHPGASIRTTMAMHLMPTMLDGLAPTTDNISRAAKQAVLAADALIAALE